MKALSSMVLPAGAAAVGRAGRLPPVGVAAAGSPLPSLQATAPVNARDKATASAALLTAGAIRVTVLRRMEAPRDGPRECRRRRAYATGPRTETSGGRIV